MYIRGVPILGRRLHSYNLLQRNHYLSYSNSAIIKCILCEEAICARKLISARSRILRGFKEHQRELLAQLPNGEMVGI